MTCSRTLVICNEKGLHARASAKFVETAAHFDAEIAVSRNGETVDARSIMGLMMLTAGPGARIEVAATGPEAEYALAALAELVAGKFGEKE